MMLGRRHLGGLLVACALFTGPATAWAQLTLVGPTTDTIPGYPIVRGNDAAFDPSNRVYLQVSAQGPVTARFINEAGAVVGAQIPITPGTSFAAYPRVTYSPHVFGGGGGFLVTWHQNDGAGASNQVHGRLVQFGTPPVLGNDVVLGTSPLGTWWEAAPATAYSSTSQQFLVAWQQFINGEIHAIRVGVDGLPIGTRFVVSDSYARDPSVAWNPYANEFGVSYSGADGGGATVTVARVNSSGAVVRRNVIFRAAGTFITDIVFNLSTANYLVTYAAPSTRVTEVNGAGDVVGHPVTYSPVGTYDGVSLAFNRVSGTSLLVGHFTGQVGGVELDPHGVKLGAEREVTAGAVAKGSFYPRVAPNMVLKQWVVGYSRDFVSAATQLVSTTAALGTPPTDTDGDGVYDLIDQCPTAPGQTASGCPGPGAQLGDLSGDGKPDFLFQHSSGLLYSWWIRNGQFVGEGLLTPSTVPDTNWLVVSKDDFTGDGVVDLLLQNQVTGEISMWPMQGMSLINNTPVNVPITPGQWRIVATPDLNLDGHPDIVWQKSATGDLYVWLVSWSSAGAFTYLGGGQFIDNTFFPVVGSGADWQVIAAGDVTNDGKADLIFHSQSTTAVAAWPLGGTFGNQLIGSPLSLSAGSGPWRVRMVNDMNSDGKLDLVWQNVAVSAPFYAWYLNGTGGRAGEGFVGPLVNLPPAWRLVGGK